MGCRSRLSEYGALYVTDEGGALPELYVLRSGSRVCSGACPVQECRQRSSGIRTLGGHGSGLARFAFVHFEAILWYLSSCLLMVLVMMAVIAYQHREFGSLACDDIGDRSKAMGLCVSDARARAARVRTQLRPGALGPLASSTSG